MFSDDQLLRELEKRFKQNKESLEELQTLTSQLRDVNKKLEDSEALKTHFISNITNEIINPFAAILGLSRSIMDVKKENWDKVVSMVQLIHSEAFNLDFQLKNIFAAAKLEAGEWLPEIIHVDVVNLVHNTLDAFKYEAAKRRISYSVHIAADILEKFYFLTDPEKLKIIISNLVSNAIKFSHTEGEIMISIEQEADNLCISVIDYGIGVSDENRQIIFDRFRRIDNGINSINRGHGLGLSINKAIIDLLNGEMHMSSNAGEKTVFTIKIPAGQAQDGNTLSGDGNEYIFDNENGEFF
jgi:signal transduction histidine kinase